MFSDIILQIKRAYKSVPIKKKILATNGLFVALFLLSSILIATNVLHQTDIIEEQGTSINTLNTVGEVSTNFDRMRFWLSDLSVSLIMESEEKAEKQRELLDSGFVKLELIDKEKTNKLRALVTNYYEMVMEAVDAYTDDNRVLGNQLNANARTMAESIDSVVVHLTSIAQTSTQNAGEMVLENNSTILWQTFWLTLIIIVVCLFLGYVFANSITRPIEKLNNMTKRVKEGDLNQHIETDYRDEIGELTLSINEMVSSIRQGIDDLNTHKESIERQITEATAELEKEKKVTDDEKAYLAKSIEVILGKMEQFSEGMLNVSLSVEKADEIGKLYNGFNASVKNIRDTISQLAEMIIKTADASHEIYNNSIEMAETAETQLARTTDCSAAMQEMNSTLSEIANNTKSATTLANDSKAAAEDGGKIINDTIESINRISEVFERSTVTLNALSDSSTEIGQIVNIINDIAMQTNLLALNAAIEAASAGEHGRGFSVVADEVRKLAERTTKATKEINWRIDRIKTDTDDAVVSMRQGVDEIEHGKEMADKAIKSLDYIINSSVKVSDSIEMISQSTQEQVITCEELNKLLIYISDSSKISKDSTEQISNSTSNLSELAQVANNQIQHFKI